MTKLPYYLSIIILVSAIGLMAVLAFWLLYPYQPLVLKDPVFPLVNKVVKQGTDLQFISDNCKNVDLTAHTSRAFVDDIVYYVLPITTSVRKGCGKVTITVPVPSNLPPGKYTLQNIFEYKVNPIRIVTVTHNTEEFEVIK